MDVYVKAEGIHENKGDIEYIGLRLLDDQMIELIGSIHNQVVGSVILSFIEMRNFLSLSLNEKQDVTSGELTKVVVDLQEPSHAYLVLKFYFSTIDTQEQSIIAVSFNYFERAFEEVVNSKPAELVAEKMNTHYVKITYMSFDGPISIAVLIEKILFWINMNVGQYRNYDMCLWKVQKKDPKTLKFYFQYKDEERVKYYCDVDIDWLQQQL